MQMRVLFFASYEVLTNFVNQSYSVFQSEYVGQVNEYGKYITYNKW